MTTIYWESCLEKHIRYPSLREEVDNVSARREHRSRLNQKISYIAEFEFWADLEPPMICFWSWLKWLKRRPKMEGLR